MQTRTTYILDTHGLLYQLFHALPPMSSPKGEPVGAVYGFTKDLFGLIERYQPDYLFCAFDLPGQTFRSELYAEYKANRSEMPDDLKPQIGFVHEILEAFGIPQLSLPGFEADDIMATVARLTAEQQGECVIVTSDKDCRQLINDHVSLLNLRKQTFYKAENLLADWGIRPDQVVDFQAFVGDSSDNVPGVAKVGQKTAAELLQQFNTLEGVYENIGKMTGKKKEHLLAGKENALLSRKLVTLNNDVPIEVRWTEYQGIDREKLRTLFQRFGFKSLMAKLEDGDLMIAGSAATRSDRIEPPSDPVAALRCAPGYHLIDTPEKFRDALAKGLGRAVRYVRETSADAVREILLDACLHCKTYDTQGEGFRADWLFNLIELTKEPDYYRAKILEAIPENRDADSYDFWQLYYLVKEFAAQGDTECRAVLYREFDLLVNDNNIGGEDALIEIDGIPGLLHALEIAGKRIQNGGDIWWEVPYHLEKSEEEFGKDTVWNAISAEASRNDFVRIFCEQREQVATSDHFGISIVDERMTNVLSKVTPPEADESDKRPVEEWIAGIMADNFDDDTIRNATEDNIVPWLLSRHHLFSPHTQTLNDEEIEIIWSALMREENPYRLFCLLHAFTPIPRRPRLPRFDPKILNLVDSHRLFLSWKAAQVLRCFSEEAIRQKALDLLRTGPAKKHWYHGFELILSSFRAEDEEVIATSLQRHSLPDNVLHSVGYDIIKLAETYPEVMFREPLLWLYDRTPCSLCRHNIVQELDKRQLVPKEIWEECIDDCSDELRTLAKEKYKANCVKRTFPANPLYHLVDTPEKFTDFFAQLQLQTIFSIDTETAPMENRFEATSPRYTVIVGMSFAWNDNEAWYIPFRAPFGSLTLPINQTLDQLRPILENPSVKKIGQNLKYDCVVLRNAGVNLQGIAFDTMLADYLLRNGATHNLDDMAEHYLQYKTTKIEALIGKGKNQKRMDAVFTETIAEYAGEDALVTWYLYREISERIEIDGESDQAKLFYEIEMPLLSALTDMEYTGITVDPDVLRTLSKRFIEKQEILEKEIYALAGHPFNIASPKQLATVLFDELGLKRVKKQSTDVEVLEELKDVHPIVEKVWEYRQCAKLRGTYIDVLPELIHPHTGRIHSSFNQVVTATGRLSSSNPNLQNIPVRTAEGREIRSAFIPGKGFDLLLSCDYSQIELRVLAHFSGDESLCEAFKNNEDIHTRVASEVFEVKPEEVDTDMRRAAKAVNFGVIYGQSAFGLSKQLGIEQKEAQKFIDGYFATYSSIRHYLESVLDDCMAKGYVATLFGRRRHFAPGTIRPDRKGGLNAAERMAINTVIQGTAADLMKQAMVKLMPLDSFEANLLLQIHDELVFEVTQKDADRLSQYVVETMLLDQPLRVPLVVDAELTKCWK